MTPKLATKGMTEVSWQAIIHRQIFGSLFKQHYFQLFHMPLIKGVFGMVKAGRMTTIKYHRIDENHLSNSIIFARPNEAWYIDYFQERKFQVS